MAQAKSPLPSVFRGIIYLLVRSTFLKGQLKGLLKLGLVWKRNAIVCRDPWSWSRILGSDLTKPLTAHRWALTGHPEDESILPNFNKASLKGLSLGSLGGSVR